MQAAGISCTGTSAINGDVFSISPDQKRFLLADGASGAGKEGKVLFGQICIEVMENFRLIDTGPEAEIYIDALFRKINTRLIEISQQRRRLVFGTLDLAVVDEKDVVITTLGDSPVYLFRTGQPTERIARNLKKCEWMIDAGYFTREQYEGYIHQLHEMMWSSFDYFLPQIVPNNRIERLSVCEGDLLLMCSDGLSDWVLPEQIPCVLKEHGLEAGLSLLVQEAEAASLDKNGKFDDITAVAVQF